jgi:hypothetical protein
MTEVDVALFQSLKPSRRKESECGVSRERRDRRQQGDPGHGGRRSSGKMGSRYS